MLKHARPKNSYTPRA